ncbi:hypothetical protein L1987_70124 [Smallanthus sonchifolius]|uniref:Uncharacterized protein n=1 Tax=Smallanthus sonchifolius TaxID=185202 RepID=A0ACB9APM6_9ASTR|nr:hypothetical protein L1987_70124 [Smallanthus sonchifolius]
MDLQHPIIFKKLLVYKKLKAPILTQSVCVSLSESEMMKKLNTPFLSQQEDHNKHNKWRTALCFITLIIVILLILEPSESTTRVRFGDAVESLEAVVAADDARCSEIGASVLRTPLMLQWLLFCV